VYAVDSLPEQSVAGYFGFLFWLYNFSMASTLSLEKILEVLRQQIPMLAERYGVETLEVFGSYVRSEQKRDSDLDVLVAFKEDPSLLTYIAIENYLSDLLGIKVDLVMKDSLKPKIGERILSAAIPV
jgi:uncharacterized protein